MHISSALLLALASLVASAPSTHALHEKRSVDLPQWVKRDRLHPDNHVPVRIALKQRNVDDGYKFLLDVSDPDSENYGKHYTSKEVIELFQPSDETVELVRAWIVKAGIHPSRITHTDNKAFLAFDSTTKEVESLFHTSFHEYEHSETGNMAVACDEYHIPKELKRHIDYVTPGVKFSKVEKRSKVAKRTDGIEKPRHLVSRPHNRHVKHMEYDLAGNAKCYMEMPDESTPCWQAVTPKCIRELYNIPERKSNTVHPQNSIAVYEQGNYYKQKDLDLFYENFSPAIPRGTHPKLQGINGGKLMKTGSNADEYLESNLDFQLVYPLVYPQEVTLYQVEDDYLSNPVKHPDTVFGTLFVNEMLDAIDGSYCTYNYKGLKGDSRAYDPPHPDPHAGGYKGELQCGVYEPAKVITISWGGGEYYYGSLYLQRQCHEIMKLGLQGVTVLASSGDTGAAGRDGCPVARGYYVFEPQAPTACYAVTSVGATRIKIGAAVDKPEVVAKAERIDYSSGGGFSNVFARPSYQEKAVQAYFKNNPPKWRAYEGVENAGLNGGAWNVLGRGYPDISANGANIATIANGCFSQGFGTSASSPIVASMIALINEERLNAGKSTVGFINPTLYANPDMFNDITEGHHQGCGKGSMGFEATPGWDPVTGMGTPDYEKMLKVFMKLK